MSTLVAYCSKHGVTKRYAERLAQELPGPVQLIDLQQEPDVDLAPYDTVVIGGAIYAGRPPKPVREFCKRHLTALQEKRLGLFICCYFDGNMATKQLQAAFSPQLIQSASVSMALGGEINPSKLNFCERLITRLITKSSDVSSRYSTDAIEGFARALMGR